MNKTVIQPVERTVLTRNIIALKQLAELRAHSDIFIPMRGMALLLSGFYRIGERDMEDIDLCVSP
ncbi:MAG TPA: hypothetical protein VJC03_07305, partial [bacterium]|nr:hypothetical protein [bacterium]